MRIWETRRSWCDVFVMMRFVDWDPLHISFGTKKGAEIELIIIVASSSLNEICTKPLQPVRVQRERRVALQVLPFPPRACLASSSFQLAHQPMCEFSLLL